MENLEIQRPMFKFHSRSNRKPRYVFFVVIVSLFSFLAAAFFMAVRMLLSSSLALGTKVCPHPFLDKFLGPLVLRDLEQQHDTLLIGDRAANLLDHVLHELGVFGEAPVRQLCLSLPMFLVTLQPTLRPMAKV